MGAAVQEIPMKIDLHVHTKYSKDSILPVNILKKISQKKGITPIITDHDTIQGNMEYGCKIIGQEIRTQQGEITGLFMMERIPRGLTIQETMDKLKQQDALIYVPHPFDRTRRGSPIRENIKHVKADIIEVFNGRTVKQEYDEMARKYAEEKNITKAVGSDAHTRFEIGKTYMIMEDFYSKKEFLKNLKKAVFVTEKAPLWVHAITKTTKRLKKSGLF